MSHPVDDFLSPRQKLEKLHDLLARKRKSFPRISLQGRGGESQFQN
jgi:hypothetical protein